MWIGLIGWVVLDGVDWTGLCGLSWIVNTFRLDGSWDGWGGKYGLKHVQLV